MKNAADPTYGREPLVIKNEDEDVFNMEKRITLHLDRAASVTDEGGSKVYATQIVVSLYAQTLPVKAMRQFIKHFCPDDPPAERERLLETLLHEWDVWDTQRALLLLTEDPR